MENLFLLVFCFAAGIVLRWSGRLPDNTPAVLNGFVIHLSLPALIILYVQPLPLDVAILYPVAAPWLLFLLSLCFFSMLQRMRGWKPATTGGLVLTGGWPIRPSWGFQWSMPSMERLSSASPS